MGSQGTPPVTRDQAEISRLSSEAQELKEQLRAERAQRDDLTVQLHNQHPRKILKRKLYAALGFVQRMTPAPVRDFFRPAYLRFYRRVFPHGLREFGSADLVRSREKNIPSPVPKTENRTERTDSPSAQAPVAAFECYPTYRPLVSIVLPVWNQPEFLGESIRSVLGQSYERIELIVVDDGSTVDLSPALEEFRNDTRLRTIRKEHAGIAPALNAGFRMANGEFFTWTSADNVMHGEAIGTLVDFLLRHPATGMVYANIELMDEGGKPLVGSDVRVINQRAHASHLLDLPESIETLDLAEDNFIGACFLYRGSAAGIVGDFDGSRLGTEDYDFWLRMNMAATIRHLDSKQCLYRYRVHGKSLTSKYGRTVVAENVSGLLRHQRERKDWLHQPFEVDILYDGAPLVPAETVVAIAAALQREGHRVTAYSTPIAAEESREWLSNRRPASVAGMASGGARRRNIVTKNIPMPCGKQILLSFIDSRLLEAKGQPFPSSSALRLQWLPPEARLDKWPDVPESSWLLCGSAGCLNRLRRSQRRCASLMIPSRDAYHHGSLLFLKARDNSYPVSENLLLEKPLALYVGSTEKTFLNADILLDAAERHPEIQFVVMENAGVKSAAASNPVQAMNILYLQGKSRSKLLAYLSQATLLLAPLQDGQDRIGEMQDLCHLYLLAGKPILATDALRAGGLHDIPNAFVVRPGSFAETLPAALEIHPNRTIADEYRLSRSATQIARNLISIANSRLFAAVGHGVPDDALRETAQPG